MRMSMNEKKALYAFGCPNREATVERYTCSRSCGKEAVLHSGSQAE